MTQEIHSQYKKLEKVYFPEIDVIKGIAILLIIFGHSFCEFPVNLVEQLNPKIQIWIGQFNLHLFF